MSKRILALLLCLMMVVPFLASCSKVTEDQPGAYITMYLTDEIYDFDPANAFYGTGAYNVVSLLFETLFELDENGKVKKSLAKDYEIIDDTENDEYAMIITLKDTCWSNGQVLTAEDIVFAWRRLLNQENSYEAAALLFDIENARAVKEGDEAIDDLGVEALEPTILKITFEGRIDYDQFLLNLTSLATAPLPESYVQKNADWAKKPSTMITSGPFKLGKIKYEATGEKAKDDNAINEEGEIKSSNSNIMELEYFYLERNRYYLRNDEKDALDKYVNPYRILVDCSATDEELLKAYNAGKLFYIGDIPLSLRNKIDKDDVEISQALSTTVCYMNEDIAPFDNASVRQALSLAIDRNAIAKKVVYAEAATALVPPGVFNAEAGRKAEEFREKGGDLISAKANMSAANALLSEAGITPSDYSFSIKVAAYNDVHVAVAEMIAAAWNELDFDVSVEKVFPIENNDFLKSQDEVPKDICDDLFIEAFQRRKYEVILTESVAYSADAYSMLANYATAFSGMALMRSTDADGKLTYNLAPNRTGYVNEQYNLMMEAIYYIPYFSSLSRNSYQMLGDDFYTKEEYQALYDQIKAIYNKYNVTPTDDEEKWAEQKAKLLHKAEKLLMKDMPVIPVIFNQNAVLASKEVKKIDASYYSPMVFDDLKLKNYEDYTYTLVTRDSSGAIVEKEIVSIFENFPEIEWDKIGKTIDK